MQFDELYPSAKPLQELEHGGYTIMKCETGGVCTCGAKCTWIDFCFQGYFCSEECMDSAHRDYEEFINMAGTCKAIAKLMEAK